MFELYIIIILFLVHILSLLKKKVLLALWVMRDNPGTTEGQSIGKPDTGHAQWS